MFAKRNSATLALIWIIVLCTGTFWHFSDTQTLADAKAEEIKIQKKLEESRKEVSRLTNVENIHGELSSNLNKSPKRIISADEPSFTLSYINWIVSTNQLNIFYDFVLNSKVQDKDVTRFEYTIAGEGPFNDISQLVWHLAYEPILYLVDRVNLVKRGDDSDYVKFTMKLRGFSVDTEEAEEEDFSDYTNEMANSLARQHNIFQPLIQRKVEKPKEAVVKREAPTLPPRQPGEIDVTSASLKAVTPTAIFLADGNSGVKQLKVGDRVYLGQLTRISLEDNSAEFVITKFGRSERVVLTIDQRQ